MRFYPANTTGIVLDNEASLATLLNALETDVSRALVDMGARSGDVLHRWMGNTDFVPLCEEMGFRMTVAFVISSVVDSVALLKAVVDQMEATVDYGVVKNAARGRAFEVYDKSKTRMRIMQDLGGVEITLPELAEHAYQKVDQSSISWNEATTSAAFPLAVRQYVKVWQRRGFEQIEMAGGML